MVYQEDIITQDWLKHLKDMMPKECKDVVDKSPDDTYVAKNDEFGWFIIHGDKVTWKEKNDNVPDSPEAEGNRGEESEEQIFEELEDTIEFDEELCPLCGGECYCIVPFKQCKDCGTIFKDGVEVE